MPDPESEKEKVFKSMDIENSNKITKFQFSSWFTRKISGIKGQGASKIESTMRKLFGKFDIDNSGYIDRLEFGCVFNWMQLYFDA
mmetsp:Transcript_10497/g.9059  ORF Transcript_10497/g.9059 Transcript_10497/m.9059 type:complete len:85 (-) Transcript_10497:1828-2082(-)